MATQRQIDANRSNARLSTGPATPEGKSRAALNALKHGLSAQTLLLDNESYQRFDSFLESLVEHYRTANSEELACVEELASARWRQRRVWAISAALLGGEMDRQSNADPKLRNGSDEIPRVFARLRSLQAQRDELREIEKCTNEPNFPAAGEVPAGTAPLPEPEVCLE